MWLLKRKWNLELEHVDCAGFWPPCRCIVRGATVQLEVVYMHMG